MTPAQQLASALRESGTTVVQLGFDYGTPLRVAGNAMCARPVATIWYLRLCVLVSLDPAPTLKLERGTGPDFDFSYFAMGLKLRRRLNEHTTREAGRAAGLSAPTISRAERGEPMQIGVVLALCLYIGVHPFGYMRDCST